MNNPQIARLKTIASLIFVLLFCIASNGQENVGIGTTSPDQKLSVNGKISIGDDVNMPTEGAIKSNSDGFGSISLGHNSGVHLAADSSIAIGYGTVVFGQNSIAFGTEIEINSDNYVRIGNDNVTTIGGAVGWSVVSDGRFKVNVEEDVPGLTFINRLRPVTYNLDKGKKAQHTGGSASGLTRLQTGFIAQEVEQAAMELNYDFSAVHTPQNKKDHYTLSYAQFVVPLVQAVQELDEENKMLKAELKEMRSFQAIVMERLKRLEDEKGIVSLKVNKD